MFAQVLTELVNDIDCWEEVDDKVYDTCNTKSIVFYIVIFRPCIIFGFLRG